MYPCPDGVSRLVVPSPLNEGWWDIWEREWGYGWVLVATTTRHPEGVG